MHTQNANREICLNNNNTFVDKCWSIHCNRVDNQTQLSAQMMLATPKCNRTDRLNWCISRVRACVLNTLKLTCALSTRGAHDERQAPLYGDHKLYMGFGTLGIDLHRDACMYV